MLQYHVKMLTNMENMLIHIDIPDVWATLPICKDQSH